jgi:hypothetical protein
MNLLALMLAMAGTAVLLGAGTALWISRRSPEPGEPEMLLCEAPSPDDCLRCDQEIGHLGWHRCEVAEWYGDSWAVSEWADTQEALPVDPEPTMSAADWAKLAAVKPIRTHLDILLERRTTAELEALLKERMDLVKTERQHPPEQGKVFTGPNESWAVWELKVEAKRRGLTGYSKLNKMGLLALLDAGPKPEPKKEPRLVWNGDCTDCGFKAIPGRAQCSVHFVKSGTEVHRTAGGFLLSRTPAANTAIGAGNSDSYPDRNRRKLAVVAVRIAVPLIAVIAWNSHTPEPITNVAQVSAPATSSASAPVVSAPPPTTTTPTPTAAAIPRPPTYKLEAAWQSNGREACDGSLNLMGSAAASFCTPRRTGHYIPHRMKVDDSRDYMSEINPVDSCLRHALAQQAWGCVLTESG